LGGKGAYSGDKETIDLTGLARGWSYFHQLDTNLNSLLMAEMTLPNALHSGHSTYAALCMSAHEMFSEGDPIDPALPLPLAANYLSLMAEAVRADYDQSV
jgi:hypothetical protein